MSNDKSSGKNQQEEDKRPPKVFIEENVGKSGNRGEDTKKK